jgi:hypothetical protein
MPHLNESQLITEWPTRPTGGVVIHEDGPLIAEATACVKDAYEALHPETDETFEDVNLWSG